MTRAQAVADKDAQLLRRRALEDDAPSRRCGNLGPVIIIAGHLRVAASERSRYLTAVEGAAIQARQAPGCQDFVQSADPMDPERINIYERYDSD